MPRPGMLLAASLYLLLTLTHTHSACVSDPTIFVTQSPSDASVFSTLTPPLIAELRPNAISSDVCTDDSSTRVFAVLDAPTASGATLIGNTSVTVVAGVATFSSLQVTAPSTSVAAPFTLRVEVTGSAGGLSADESETFLVTGDPVRLQAPITVDASYTAGQVWSTLQVNVLDDNSLQVADSDLQVRIAARDADTGEEQEIIGNTGAYVVSSGTAQLPGLSMTKAGTYIVRYTLELQDGTSLEPILDSAEFVIEPAGVDGLVFDPPPTGVDEEGRPYGGIAGDDWREQPRVRLRDEYGNLITDVSSGSCSLTIASQTSGTPTLTPSATAVTSVSSGVCSFSGVGLSTPGGSEAGGVVFEATFASISEQSVAVNFIDADDLPALMQIITPAGGLIAGGSAFGQQPVVEVQLESGVAASSPLLTDAELTAQAIPADSESLGVTASTSNTATVDASTARFTFTGLRIDKIGRYNLQYLYESFNPHLSLNLTSNTQIEVERGEPARLEFVVQPGQATGGLQFGQQPVVALTDAGGNVVDILIQVAIALTPTPAPDSGIELRGFQSEQTEDGYATFRDLTIDKIGTGYRLQASSISGISPATSDPFDVLAGPVDSLIFLQSPNATVIATELWTGTGVPIVQLVDAGLNVADSDNSTEVQLYLGVNVGDATLSGNLTQRAVRGQVRFDGISIDKVGEGYRLRADAIGTSLSGVSSNFDVLLGPFSKMIFSVQPQNTLAGNFMDDALVVQLVDAGFNTLTDVTANITLELDNNPGGSTITGDTKVLAVNGTGEFDVSLDREGNSYTLRAFSPGIDFIAISDPFNITIGPAQVLNLVHAPAVVQISRVDFPVQPLIRLEDTVGNLVYADNSSFVEMYEFVPANGSAQGTLEPSTATRVKAHFGIVTFEGVSYHGFAENLTLGFALDGRPEVPNPTISGVSVILGPLYRLSFAQQPSGGEAAVPWAVQPLLELLDEGDNLRSVDNTSHVQLRYYETFPNGTAIRSATTGQIDFLQLVNTTSTVANVTQGVAPFANLTMYRTGFYRLRAILVEDPRFFVDSDVFEVLLGSEVSLRFVSDPPSTVRAGLNFSVTLGLLDNFGNFDVEDATSFATLEIANPVAMLGNASLSGETLSYFSNGLATLNVSVDYMNTDYRLRARLYPTESFNRTLVLENPNLRRALFEAAAIGCGTNVTMCGERYAKNTLVFCNGTAEALNATGCVESAVCYTNVTSSACNCTHWNTLESGAVNATLSADASCVMGSSDLVGVPSTVNVIEQVIVQSTDLSTPFSVLQGPLHSLSISVEPQDLSINVPFNPQPQVELLDLGRNRYTPNTTNVVRCNLNRAETGRPINSRLTGTREVVPVDGLATYGDLSVSSQDTYVLEFELVLGALEGVDEDEDLVLTVTSRAFVTSDAVPTDLAFLATWEEVFNKTAPFENNQLYAPWYATHPFPVPIQVAILDAVNDIKIGDSVSEMVITPNNRFIPYSVDSRRVTVDSGVGSFTNFRIDRTGNFSVRIDLYSTFGVLSRWSTRFAVLPDVPSALKFTTQPVGGPAEQPLRTQPVVMLVDRAENRIRYHEPFNVTLELIVERNITVADLVRAEPVVYGSIYGHLPPSTEIDPRTLCCGDPRNFTILGTWTRPAIGGIARFDDLQVDTSDRDLALQASASVVRRADELGGAQVLVVNGTSEGFVVDPAVIPPLIDVPEALANATESLAYTAQTAGRFWLIVQAVLVPTEIRLSRQGMAQRVADPPTKSGIPLRVKGWWMGYATIVNYAMYFQLFVTPLEHNSLLQDVTVYWEGARVVNGNTDDEHTEYPMAEYSNLASKGVSLFIVLVLFVLLPGHYVETCFADFQVQYLHFVPLFVLLFNPMVESLLLTPPESPWGALGLAGGFLLLLWFFCYMRVQPQLHSKENKLFHILIPRGRGNTGRWYRPGVTIVENPEDMDSEADESDDAADDDELDRTLTQSGKERKRAGLWERLLAELQSWKCACRCRSNTSRLAKTLRRIELRELERRRLAQQAMNMELNPRYEELAKAKLQWHGFFYRPMFNQVVMYRLHRDDVFNSPMLHVRVMLAHWAQWIKLGWMVVVTTCALLLGSQTQMLAAGGACVLYAAFVYIIVPFKNPWQQKELMYATVLALQFLMFFVLLNDPKSHDRVLNDPESQPRVYTLVAISFLQLCLAPLDWLITMRFKERPVEEPPEFLPSSVKKSREMNNMDAETEAEARHALNVGKIYWDAQPEYRQDRRYCYASFTKAAKLFQQFHVDDERAAEPLAFLGLIHMSEAYADGKAYLDGNDRAAAMAAEAAEEAKRAREAELAGEEPTQGPLSTRTYSPYMSLPDEPHIVSKKSASKARKFFRAALKLDANCSLAGEPLARYYARNGHMHKALSIWNRAILMAPAPEQARWAVEQRTVETQLNEARKLAEAEQTQGDGESAAGEGVSMTRSRPSMMHLLRASKTLESIQPQMIELSESRPEERGRRASVDRQRELAELRREEEEERRRRGEEQERQSRRSRRSSRSSFAGRRQVRHVESDEEEEFQYRGKRTRAQSRRRLFGD